MSFAQKLKNLFKGNSIGDDFFEELTDTLIEGDVGAKTAYEITERLEAVSKKSHLKDENAVADEL